MPAVGRGADPSHISKFAAFPALLLALATPLVGADAAPTTEMDAERSFAIRNVRLFDGERIEKHSGVLVLDGVIREVGEKLTLPSGIRVFDGTGKTLLPGLIDAHAHVWNGDQLEQSLVFGVTTVLDMFTQPALVKRLRAENLPSRADLRSAGILATAPGGHGTEYGFEIPTLTTPGEAQAFADARFIEGSDYLKIVYDNGAAYGRSFPTVDRATLGALVAAAHARTRLAVVHVGTYAEARAAIEEDADGLVHLFRDRAPEAGFGELVARHGAFVTPTLAVMRSLEGTKSTLAEDPALAPFLGPDARNSLAATFSFGSVGKAGAAESAVARLRDAGVPVLCGTDAPNPGTTYGASVHEELALLVAAGLSPRQALSGATASAAARFGLTDRGRIAPGRRADLVLVDGDPTHVITDSRRIAAVWRSGVRFDREAYAARVAQAHEAAAKRPAAPAPLGPVSDFESGDLATRFGQAWVVSTDAMIGGKSAATLAVVDGGGAGTGKALAVRGEVVAGGPSIWAGAMFSPGDRPFSPADLSAKRELQFQARGDGRTYVVMLFATRRGRMPSVKTFVTGAEFAPVRFLWSDFDGLDGSDTLGIFVGSAEPGAFDLTIDEIELR